jgi:hypothetical protein
MGKAKGGHKSKGKSSVHTQKSGGKRKTRDSGKDVFEDSRGDLVMGGGKWRGQGLMTG